jgi:integrase
MYAKYCRVDQKKLEVDGFSVHQQAQGERNSRIVQTRGFARHTMRQWCLRAFKDHFRLYDLRHIYATRAAQAAIEVLTLAALLGHTTVQMTSRYVHPIDQHKRGAAQKLEAYNAEKIFEYAESVPASLQKPLQ